jgi:hypothetical protein
MPEFKKGETIVTETPKVEVTVNPNQPLPVGRHIFQLVVVDDSGNQSQPAAAEVIIRDTQKPTAVIDVPINVDAGKSFELSGARSFDLPPGKIIRYQWTLL